MRFSFYSLRTGILAYLAFLILSAMLLINVVMVKFSEKDLIEERVNAARLLLHAIAERLSHEAGQYGGPWPETGSHNSLLHELARGTGMARFSGLLVIDRDGRKILLQGPVGEKQKAALSLAREALFTKKYARGFQGSTWGVIWIAPASATVSMPLISRRGRLLGAAALCVDLRPLYHHLRGSEKIVLLYIILNTIVLVLVGFYLLSRIVVRPIHDLLRVTEQFKEGGAFPEMAEVARNEIGQLSRSLNLMLRRLEENKEELKTHIASLEEANRELKRAQEEIVRSEKLASVGRLATGIAHEIGNPIGIVLGYLELLDGEMLSEEERKDFLGRIASEITRINEIIRQLLDFSRSSTGQKGPTEVHLLLTETINMLKPQPMMAGIETRCILEAEHDTVLADPNQLKQVFLNIVMNAADAMRSMGEKKAGTLTITTRNVEHLLELRFTDTGPGIPQEDLSRIFDPFYTTKEPGRGTGLGLSVCYRIVEGLGGSIRAENSPDHGATIIVDIPLHEMKNDAKR